MFELKQLWISPNWKALLNEAGLLYGSDLQFLIMENVLVQKPDAPKY